MKKKRLHKLKWTLEERAAMGILMTLSQAALMQILPNVTDKKERKGISGMVGIATDWVLRLIRRDHPGLPTPSNRAVEQLWIDVQDAESRIKRARRGKKLRFRHVAKEKGDAVVH